MRGGGSPIAVNRGGPRGEPDGLRGWNKEGEVLTCPVRDQRAGARDTPACWARAVPGPAPAMPWDPAPAAAGSRFRDLPEVRRNEKGSGKSAAQSSWC